MNKYFFLAIFYIQILILTGSCNDNTEDPEKDEKLTDSELLDKVQEQTFKYFWDFAHPDCGLARERSDRDAYGGESMNIVTTGGSGFGVMAIIVGVERNFITRAQAVQRLHKITDFLLEADRFHGVFAHWYYGDTGKVRPFSKEDNGGDLVETAFMMQGLLTARQYFNRGETEEEMLRNKIGRLWDSIEWDWYTNGKDVLIWHWSPDYQWAINHEIRGYNEALITYVLAASSRNHAVQESVYHKGWTTGNDFENGKLYYSRWNLPLGPDYGGPLFFAQYSFLGLDPHGLKDTYADYWEQNLNHTLINREYCIRNPKNYKGYGSDSWGLTASDNSKGYAAHSPTNDLGVISPTAALASIVYTPEYSLEVIRHFYEDLNSNLWGVYGFYDAFNQTENWYAHNYLAIDQGPIIVMIENYRTGLLWNLFMSCPEVKDGLRKLGFTSPHI